MLLLLLLLLLLAVCSMMWCLASAFTTVSSTDMAKPRAGQHALYAPVGAHMTALLSSLHKQQY
jgi:hypothetical protein